MDLRGNSGPTRHGVTGRLCCGGSRNRQSEGGKVMKGFVFHGPGQSAWEQVPDPGIKDPTDAIVRVDAVTICGTDLHILKGDVPEVRPGTVLGHEAVGEIVETGSDVRTVRPGDRVLVSCITACGRCRFCREGAYGQCRGGGGWILGHRIDGTQAEYVRVPYADLSVHPLPAAIGSEDAVLLADIFPTAYEVGVLNGRVRPGDTVAVVGAGPVGLAAIVTAKLYGPERIIAVDLADSRLEAARRLGADAGVAVRDDPEQLVADLTDGLGADVVIEAVGVPESFEMCTRMVRPGGHVANVGVHGRPVTLHLEDLWTKNVTITTGLVDTSSTPMLLRMAAAGRLPTSALVTHTFPPARMEEAYDVFARAADTGALKVVLGGQRHDTLAVPAD
jgi:alcohol dehydrogenase